MKECSILWYGKYQQNWENAEHSHNYFQLFIVLSGCGAVVIDDDRQLIIKDRIYLIKPMQQHAINCDQESEEPLRLLDVKFSVADPALCDDLIKVVCPFSTDHLHWYTGCFDRIIGESTLKEKYYYNMINNLLYMMLIRLIREAVYGKSDREPEDKLETEPLIKQRKGINFEQLMNFIHFNYSNIIGLDDLATLSKVSKTILIDTFKSVYGTTPICYINQLRLQKAKELLVNTDTSIGEIARLIGFQSIYYFSRTFKAKENCTPMAYRQQHAESKYCSF
ncbi:MAG: AraC family transcriptional regulator [Clostridiaceae bacterium]|nr:AraC family transcriptional regulator [Clostridiaceae bacterium]